MCPRRQEALSRAGLGCHNWHADSEIQREARHLTMPGTAPHNKQMQKEHPCGSVSSRPRDFINDGEGNVYQRLSRSVVKEKLR